MSINVYIINLLLFNIGWLCCVLGGSVVALPVTIVASWIHFSFVSAQRAEVALLVMVTGLGFVIDSLLFSAGILQYENIISPLSQV